MNNLNLIENYLDGTMSSEEIKLFESQLENDPILRQLLDDYKMTFDGLRRVWVKDTLGQLNKKSFIKNSLIGAAIVLIALFTAITIARQPESNKKDLTPSLKTDTFSNSQKADSSKPMTFDTISEEETETKTIEAHDSPLTIIALPSNNLPEPLTTDTTMAFNPLTGVDWQYVNIDNTVDNRIVLKGGTILQIDSGILITSNGKSNLKDVRLKIKEFSNYYDLWQEGLHTCSDKKRLISGGSCYIEAESLGEKVDVKENEDFTIFFPGAKDNDMTVFYGGMTQQGTFDWTKGETLSKNDATNARPLDKDLNRAGSKSQPKITLSDTIWFLEPVVMDEGYINGKYKFNTLEQLGSFKNVFDDLAATPIDGVKTMFLKKKNLLFRFHLDSSGYFDRYDYNFAIGRKNEKTIKKEANELLGKTKIDIKNLQFKELIVNVTLLPNFKIINIDSVLSDSSLKKITNYKDNERIYNAIVSSKFGYINCDHFSEKVEQTVMTIHSQMGALQDVRIFFKSDYSVMTTIITKEGAESYKLPFDEEIVVIGISKDGKRMFIQETLTDTNVYSGPGEPFNAMKIKDILMKYGTTIANKN